jgi:hypothetical protein
MKLHPANACPECKTSRAESASANISTGATRREVHLAWMVALLLAISVLPSYAVVLDVSTGIGIAAGGLPDTIWVVQQAGGGVAPAQTVFPNDADWGAGAWVANSPPVSSWIARDANDCCKGGGTYTFSTTFYIDNPSTASISGTWTVDNFGTLAVNGNTIAKLATGKPFTSLHPFTASGNSFFVAGMNILTITLTGDGYLDGVRLNASVTGASLPGWQPLVNPPSANVGPMLQLRDGRILIHEEQAGDAHQWYFLTPDIKGSYVNGTWSQAASLPAYYAPFYFSSQVMLDGKVLVEGGEYNLGAAAWTTLGALGTITPHGPMTWTANTPPKGWATIGDAQSVILANGVYMQANCCTTENELYSGPNLWTATSSTLSARNNEQGWTLLPNDDVLTVDTSTACGSTTSSEYYHLGSWNCGPTTGVKLYGSDDELGAAVLMYNGKVLQLGGSPSATAIYTPSPRSWTTGPVPTGYNQADGPASLEPNGKVLAMLSPGVYNSGCQMFEYDPSVAPVGQFSLAPNPLNCPADSSFYGHLMILPTGQIMFTDLSGRVEVYTPAPGYLSATPPYGVTTVAGPTVHKLSTNQLKGYNLNGLTQNNAYGDDYQGDTNYPLVRLSCGGNVYFANTHDETTHSIAPGTLVTTEYDLDPATPLGACGLEVIANGVAGSVIPVTVVP